MSRSCINLIGNTVKGENLGEGIGFFKQKVNGNFLQFRSLSASGATTISQDGDNIIISGTSGVAEPAGSDYEIQFNSGNTLTASPQLSYISTGNSFTAGYRDGIIGENSVVLGGSSSTGGNEASNVFSVAFGNNTTASGQFSTAFGINTIANGNKSTAFGCSTNASGFISTAFGYFTTANSNYSTAFGRNTISSGDISSSFGCFTEAHDFLETALGQCNIVGTGSQTSWAETDNLFTIGNGTGTTRSNAFQILKNGNTTIDGDLSVNNNISSILTYDADYSTTSPDPRWIPDAAWVTGQTGGESGATTFLALDDTPFIYEADKWLRVDSGGTELIYTDFISWTSFEFRDIVAGISTEYTIDLKASIPYLINSAVMQVNDGTLDDVRIEVNGTAVPGLSGVTVSTTITEYNATSSYNVSSGDIVTLYVGTTYTGDPSFLRGKINIKYN